MIYLDNAATTFVKPQSVTEAVIKAFRSCTSSGRGSYESAMKASEIIFSARETACNLFGSPSPEQVVFTSNATHALNLAIKGLSKKGNCVISGYEHNSVVRPIKANELLECRVAKGKLFTPEMLLKNFERLIDKETAFAVCTHMSNVFGYILPIERIDEVCSRKGIPLIIDASQSAGCIPIKLSRLRACVCICMPGHKGLYGPQGTGVLVCRNGEKLSTVIEGGTGSVSKEFAQPDFMPDRLECGTHNVPGIAGLLAGMSYVSERGETSIMRRERRLIHEISKNLQRMEGLKIFVPDDMHLQGGVLSFVSDRKSPEEISNALARRKIAVRSGFHCSPLAHSMAETTEGTVRVSVSDFTAENEVYLFLKTLSEFLSEQ